MKKILPLLSFVCSLPCLAMQSPVAAGAPRMVQLEAADKQQIAIDPRSINSSLINTCITLCHANTQTIIPIPNAPTKELLEQAITIRTKNPEALPDYLAQFDWQTLITITDIYDFLFPQPHDQDHNDQNFDILVKHTLNTIINALGNQAIDEQVLNQRFFTQISQVGPVLDTLYQQEAVTPSPFQKIRSIFGELWEVAALKLHRATIVTQKSPETLRICRLDNRPDIDIQTGHAAAFELIPTREPLPARRTPGFFDVMLSPDGTKIAADTIGATGRVWNAKTGKLLYFFGEHQNEFSVSWSPNSTKLVTRHQIVNGHQFHIWDTTNGSLMCTLPEQTTIPAIPDTGNPWSPDSTKLVSLSTAGVITLLNTSNGTEVCHFAPEQIRRFSWNPNSTSLATLSDTHTIKIWRARDGALIHTIDEHPAFCFSWSPDGTMLAVASGDTVFLWDTSTQHPFLFGTLNGDTTLVDSVSWSWDSSKLAVATHDNTIKVWAIKERASIATIGSPEHKTRSLTWTPHNTLLATFTNSPAEIWNFNQNPPTRTFTTPELAQATSTWIPDTTSSLASCACPLFVNSYRLGLSYRFEEIHAFITRSEDTMLAQFRDFFGQILAHTYVTPLQKLLLIKLARNVAHNTHLTPTECSRVLEIYQTLPTTVAQYVDQLAPEIRPACLGRVAYAIVKSADFAAGHFA